MAPRTDAEAIAASLAEPREFVAVFERHFDAIHRYLRRRVGKAIADELASETFAQAFEHRKRYDRRRADVRPWLYGIAHNLLRHHYRDEERALRDYARSAALVAAEPPDLPSSEVAELLAASAFALYDFIAGDPAPPSVTRLIVEEGTAERIGPMFVGRGDVLAREAHGVAALETSKGRVLLWAAPTKGNAICYFVEFERLSERSGSPKGEANCGYRPPPNPPVTLPFLFALHRATIDGSELAILVGWIHESVVSVSLRSPEGDERELDLFENFFIAEIPADRVPNASRDGEPYQVVATNRAGDELRPLGITEFTGSLWLQSMRSPKITGPKRTVIETTDSRGRLMRLSLIPVEGGTSCSELETAGGTSGSCGPRLRVDEGIQVHPALIESMVFLHGSVGPEVSKLELHHEDGYAIELPIVERFVLHDIPRGRFEEGRRPALLVARGGDGVEVAREKVTQKVFQMQTQNGQGDVVDPSPGRPGQP